MKSNPALSFFFTILIINLSSSPDVHALMKSEGEDVTPGENKTASETDKHGWNVKKLRSKLIREGVLSVTRLPHLRRPVLDKKDNEIIFDSHKTAQTMYVNLDSPTLLQTLEEHSSPNPVHANGTHLISEEVIGDIPYLLRLASTNGDNLFVSQILASADGHSFLAHVEPQDTTDEEHNVLLGVPKATTLDQADFLEGFAESAEAAKTMTVNDIRKKLSLCSIFIKRQNSLAVKDMLKNVDQQNFPYLQRLALHQTIKRLADKAGVKNVKYLE